ncbi:hypothetical protein DVQ53_22565 [Yersinia enterocolitica]|nr:hypothetical protein [Yersinia enterocolitica]
MALNTIGQGECLNSPGIAKLSGRFSDGIGLFRTIKKPACGRLLGDWLSLFLVNLTSLQLFTQALAQVIEGGHQRELLRIAGQGVLASRQPLPNVPRMILTFPAVSQRLV